MAVDMLDRPEVSGGVKVDSGRIPPVIECEGTSGRGHWPSVPGTHRCTASQTLASPPGTAQPFRYPVRHRDCEPSRSSRSCATLSC